MSGPRVTIDLLGTLTEANNNAANFTRQVKLMLEAEARTYDLELDSRNNPWDMYNQLEAHIASLAPQTVPDDGPAAESIPE